MTDSAALVARIKTEGAAQGAAALDKFSDAAVNAEITADALARTQTKLGQETKKTAPPVQVLSGITEQLGNKIAILEEAQEKGARAASILAAQLRAGADASQEEITAIGQLAGEVYDLSEAQTKAAKTAQDLARQQQQTDQAAQSLASQIALVETAQNKGARAAAVLAAQLKLGANASEEQKNRIGELAGRLHDLQNVQEHVASGAQAANDGFKNFRNVAQQAGYQVQDLVVQLQGGTSAFVAIGQQGSQLAGAFGPGGAVLGAVIALASAVGGVLYKSFQDAADSAKGLQDATSNLQTILKQGSDGAMQFTDELLKLAEVSNAAALSKLASSLADAQTQIKAAGNAAAEATKQFESWWYGSIRGAAVDLKRLSDEGMNTAQVLATIGDSSRSSAAMADTLRGVVGDLSKTLKISNGDALEMVRLMDEVQRTKSPEAVQALADRTAQLQSSQGTANAELNKFNNVLQEAVVQMANGKSAAEALQGAYDNLGGTIDKLRAKQAAASESFVASLEMQSKRGKALIEAQAQQQLASIKNRDDLTEEQRKRAQQAVEAARVQDIKDFEDRENTKTTKAAAAGQKRLDAEAARAAKSAATQKQQADAFLQQIERTNTDVIAKADAVEKQRLEKLQQFNQQGLIVGQQYEDAKTAIQLNAEDVRQQELDKRKQQQVEKDSQHDQFIANIQAMNATELEQIDAQQQAKEAKAKEYYDKGLINEQEYQDSLKSIQGDAEKKKLDSYSDTLSSTTSALKSAMGEQSGIYKAAAIAQATIDTYKAANAAYSAMAGIPIVGPFLGAAAAAAAVVAGLSQIGKIRSAREQGGNLAPGQMSTIAERGKPEVIMPAGASRVRTAQQMRQIMGDDRSSGSNNGGVVIVNNTTGRIDSATTERDDEGRLRVIIDEHVSSSLMDSNSRISKSRRATRHAPGF